MSLFSKLAASIIVLPAIAFAAPKPLIMVVQPINSQATTVANYEPLADYLAAAIDREVELQPIGNYMTFWGLTRRDDQFDIAIDAAHMTSYRVAAKDFAVIAKVESVVSYSVVTREDIVLFDTDELMGRRVATLPSPGLGAIRLLAMFPNAARQPVLVPAENAEAAVRALYDDQVVAAVIPTPLVSLYDGLNVVETTEQVPSPAVSVSSHVDAQTAARLRTALLQLSDTEAGRTLLATAKLSGFEVAEDADYQGYHGLLNGVWGYDSSLAKR